MYISFVMYMYPQEMGERGGGCEEEFVLVVVAGVEKLTLYAAIDHWWQKQTSYLEIILTFEIKEQSRLLKFLSYKILGNLL